MVCKASFVVKCCYSSYIRFLEMGRIAQVVEQLTLNQRVQGSSPCAPTIFLQFRIFYSVNCGILLLFNSIADIFSI